MSLIWPATRRERPERPLRDDRSTLPGVSDHIIVVTEGDSTDPLYIVVSGRIKIYASDAKGKEVVLNHAGPGEYFGELVLDGGPRLERNS